MEEGLAKGLRARAPEAVEVREGAHAWLQARRAPFAYPSLPL